MKFRNGFKIGSVLAVFIILCSSASWAEWNEVFFDDFDDGNYDGWTVADFMGESDVRSPDVVLSPEGYSVRGTGSGYQPDWACCIVHPINLQNAREVCIEMRARSGSQSPNAVNAVLLDGQDFYAVRDYGEGNHTADWTRHKGTLPNDEYRYSIGERAHSWHTFAWCRDSDGWWSLSIDGVTEVSNFRQDLLITSFDNVELHLHRDQSEIEWVRISAVPTPMEVEIDIKPGSDPNPINQGSNGLVPVAIFSSPEFDATTVDPTSVSLAGASVAVRGKGKSMTHEEDVNGDGLVDLVVQVETQGFDDLGAGGTVELTGTTFGGEDIVGYDEVVIVPPDQ